MWIVKLTRFVKWQIHLDWTKTHDSHEYELSGIVCGSYFHAQHVIRSFPNAFCGYEHELIGTQFFFVYPQKIVDQVNLDLGNEAKKFDLNKISDKQLKRKLKMLKTIGTSALPKGKLDR